MKIFIISNANIGKKFFGRPCLLLIHKGARTNLIRKSVLVYYKEKETFIIVASNGGSKNNPSWYHNLSKNKIAKVKIGKKTYKVTAKEILGDEKTSYWNKIDRINRGGYTKYQTMTSRSIPIFKLNIFNS